MIRGPAGGGSNHPADDDEGGSILILTIGYAALALALILVCVDATSLYLAQKRLDAVADAAALAAADGFVLTVDADGPHATLSTAEVHHQAAAIVAAAGGDTRLVSASAPDGVSARVTVATSWRPPVLTFLVPDGVALEASATSRTALR